MTARPKILCISYSPLVSDARVLRQLSVLADFGQVTTVGYGSATRYSTRHIEIPTSLKSLPQTPLGVLRLATHVYGKVDLAAPAVMETLRQLGQERFDAVVANDARAVPAAITIAKGAPVWVDMHEWAPEENSQVLAWKLLVAPWAIHVCKNWLPKADEVTTVGQELANLYQAEYGIATQIMRNASRFVDQHPTPVLDEGPIRLVHSGIAAAGRGLEKTIEAINSLGDAFSLDLYLMPAGDGGKMLHKLKELSSQNLNITFHEPVTPNELPAVLNSFDVGVFWIAPATTNARFTLPNKFFDFVQARLALAVGPTVEMANLVREHNLGVISDGFDVPDIVASLRTLTKEKVWAAKQASHQAAKLLSFEHEADTARQIMRELLKV